MGSERSEVDVSETPPPDWAALYQKHRDAMYRVAARTLREAGRHGEAEDAVMAAMESLMKAPPSGVVNWEAMMVHAAKMRALDMLRSAEARHASSESIADDDGPVLTSVEDDVIEVVDRQRAAAVAWDKLAILPERDRRVVWEYVAKGRPRSEVAAEFDVTPARVSQISTKALRQLKDALETEGVEP